MAYKRTGRPPGRPKTKEYVTLLARVSVELADLVKRYAAERGQLPVSELIREGLEWRIGDGDPRGTGLYLSQPTGISEKAYSSNTETALGAQGEEALREIRALLVQQGKQIQVLARAFERQTVAAQSNVYSSNTGSVLAVGVNDGEAGPVEYDRTKFKLGKLCKGGHEFGHTGQSLLTIKGSHCPPCRAAQERERQRVKREAQEAGVTS
jgi:hypothetical protein